jgi:hypothetical protein
MKSSLSLTTFLASAVLLGACGNSPEAKDPSKTDTTAAPDTKAAADTTAKPGDATPAKPVDATPAITDAKPAATDAKPVDAKLTATDAKPAEAADGKCKDVPKPTAKDAKGCMADCSKLDAKAPAGSKCLPPKTACEQQCKTLGK